MTFEFATSGRILFGAGILTEAVKAIQPLGRRALLVTGRATDRAERLIALLTTSGMAAVPFSIPGEPEIPLIREGVRLAREEQCGIVISFGGGSAIDGGKAIAALLPNSGEPLDYLEVIGKGNPLSCAPLPFVAIPTTSGTGSEATRNAVLASPEHKVKASMRSAAMLPKLAIVDPELTLGLPPAITAATGLDALTQLIEPYTSIRANPLIDAICLEGIRRAARSLPRAFSHPHDLEARTDMSLAGLFGGIALANAALGAVHGFAAPIGGMFPAPHGAVCASLLPHVTEANIAALEQRAPDSEKLARYQTVAGILTRDSHARPRDAAAGLHSLCRSLLIPPLRDYGIMESDIPAIVSKALQASSMKGNALPLTAAELSRILKRAI
ncbi:MAG: iron-containing alcohol dehydrogenase [Bryobacterales bacterium]|nr:iron-containing alcohol dehydrogenase [Bryobacterales bacterium]